VPPGSTPEHLVIIETKPLNPPELWDLQPSPARR